MKIVTKSGSQLEFDIKKLKEDLKIQASDINDLWFINVNGLLVKDIVLLVNDRRKVEKIPYQETDIHKHDVLIYLKDSKKPIIIENIDKEDINIKISENTNYEFDIKFKTENVNFYLKEEYITGIVIKSKESSDVNVNNNKLYVSLSNYDDLIEIEDNEKLQKIDTEKDLIIHSKSDKQECYFRNVSSFWLNKKIKTGNHNYIICLKNNKKIILKNKEKINYTYDKKKGLILNIKDSSIVCAAYSTDIDYIKSFENHIEKGVSKDSPKNKSYIKDI